MEPRLRTALALLLLSVAVAAPAGSALLNQRTLQGSFSVPAYYATQRMSTQAGGSVEIHDELGPNEIAILATAVSAVEYCGTANSVVTAGAPAPAPFVSVDGADLSCANPLGSYAFPSGCLAFTTGPGVLDATQPVFLTDLSGAGFCNSLVGNPSICPVPVCGSFVVEFCTSVETLDTIVGTTKKNEDTDWLYVDGPSTTAADLAWALSPNNQSNLGANNGTGAC